MNTDTASPTTLIFEGRVLPERRRITLPSIDAIQYSDPTGFSAVIKIRVSEGKVVAICTPSEANVDVGLCLARSTELANASVDAYAFSKGYALIVIFDTVIVDGEASRGIALSELSVRRYNTTLLSDADFQTLMPLLFNDFHLKFALRDLITSLHTFNYSAIAAARSIESVRAALAPLGASDKEAWAHMRLVLRIEREFLDLITNASREPRHGKRGAVSGELQLIVTHRAWAVVNRYIAYIKGDRTPLDEKSFPLLRE